MIELKRNPKLNIVLYEPEIPANTGNIGRLCVGTQSVLHLIRPFRFFLDDKSLKRAGLDYWHLLSHAIHEDWESFTNVHDVSRCWFCTTKSNNIYTDIAFQEGDFLVFGPESRGLPESLLTAHLQRCITIPMHPDIRSINLSNAVAIILYEAIRKIDVTHPVS